MCYEIHKLMYNDARAFFALAINLHEASLTGVGKDNVYNAMRKPNKGCARFFRAGAVPRRLRAKRGRRASVR
jgi:hypothetical protein